MSSETTAHFNSHGKPVLTVTTVTFILASIFVAARLISRFGIVKSRTWDDRFMILAWFLALGLSFSIDFGTSRGLGRHDANIPEEWIPDLRALEYSFTILYNPALMATKTSILIFYLRIFRDTQKILRTASYVTLAIVNIAGFILTLLNAFQCSPIRAAYDPTTNEGYCTSIVTLYLASSPVNIITDLAILCLPIPVLTGMRLPRKQKNVLVVAFALGIFVTIIDVVRIYYLQQALTNVQSQNITPSMTGTRNDFAWYASLSLMWSAVEVNVGIICACIPTLKPLIKRILPSMITDHSGSGTEKITSNESQIPPEYDSFGPRSSTEGPRIQPPPRALLNDTEEQMNMMDFLTVPRMLEDEIGRTHTTHTHVIEDTVYFGFVNMKRPKSMLKTSGMESFKYCTVVTILFLLWGFSYGLLNTLNNEIGRLADQSISQVIGLTAAYFGAYLVAPLTLGQWVLRKSGFKATFISGLCIYGVGTLMFWPSAVLTSFTGFIISNFVVGFGLAVLETAANPFIALCGPSQYAEYRLLLAQGVQAVGSVLSQLLAERVLFASIARTPSLIDVQWTYLAIALFTVILALFFYYMPLPEATDDDLQLQSESVSIYPTQTFFNTKLTVIYTTLALAVFSQFCYVAGQESMSVWFQTVLVSLTPEVSGSTLTLSTGDYLLVGHAVFAIGRFLFAPLCLFIPPRILLLFIHVLALVFSILVTTLKTGANTVAGPAIVFFFLEGPIWPIIYATGMRGVGRQTKMGAAFLTAGASGGAVFPFVMWGVQQINYKSIQYSYCVIVVLTAFGALFPFYLNLFPAVKKQVDPVYIRDEEERPDAPIRSLSRRFSVLVNKIRPGSVNEKTSQELRVVGHREKDGRGDS